MQKVLPQFDDDKGVGLILLNTFKGESAYAALTVESEAVHYEDAVAGNPSFYKSVVSPTLRPVFWRLYVKEGISAITKIHQKMQPSYFMRVAGLAKRIVKRIIHK